MSTNVSADARQAYYPALDGMRAVAVVLVFFQHYGAGTFFLFGWGWTGVDIFFVLSGFLITGILYDSQHRPHRIRDFYVRRTLRIFPLYYFVWGAVLLCAPVALWQWNWRWGLWPAYVGNYARFLFLSEPGNPYRFGRLTFGPLVDGWFGGAPMHLYTGHFWSLCVEEQFYLLWPFVVYKVRQRDWLIKICLVVLIACPVLRWILTETLSAQMLGMEFLYRSLPTRLDALLIGGLLALCLRGPEQEWVRKSRRWALVSSALLFFALCLISIDVLHLPLEGSASNWIGVFGFSLIDIFAGALILESIHPGSLLGRALSLRPLRALGIISYGFYVYHDLLHDFYAYFAHRYFPNHVVAATALLAFAATLAIAQVSYHLLEKPFLRLKERFTGQVHTAPKA